MYIRNGGIIFLVVIGFWVSALASQEPILNLRLNGQAGMATIEGSPAWKDGHLLFDGVDDRVVLAPRELLQLGGLREGTIVIRFKYDYTLDQQEIEPLFYYGIASESEQDNMFVIEIGHNNPRNTRLYATWVINGRPRLCFDSRVNLKPGKWYEFTVVAGLTGNTGYLNGAEMTARHYNFGGPEMALFLASVPVQEFGAIGYGKTARGKSPHFVYFKGEIDEVLIYDRPLTNVEIRALYGLRTMNEQINREACSPRTVTDR